MSARLSLDHLGSSKASLFGFLSYNRHDTIYTDGVVRREASTGDGKVERLYWSMTD
jgi:hypothetical protein